MKNRIKTHKLLELPYELQYTQIAHLSVIYQTKCFIIDFTFNNHYNNPIKHHRIPKGSKRSSSG